MVSSSHANSCNRRQVHGRRWSVKGLGRPRQVDEKQHLAVSCLHDSQPKRTKAHARKMRVHACAVPRLHTRACVGQKTTGRHYPRRVNMDTHIQGVARQPFAWLSPYHRKELMKRAQGHHVALWCAACIAHMQPPVSCKGKRPLPCTHASWRRT